MDEILFGASGKGKVKLAQALKKAKAKKNEIDVKPRKSEKWSSSTQSDSDDEDYGRGRHRRKRSQGEKISAAARLKQKAAAMEKCLQDPPPPPPGDKEDEGLDSSAEKKVKKVTPPPSPIPSPPPLVFYNYPESKQSQTLLKADQVLMELKMPQILSESLLDQSSGLDDSILITTPSSTTTAVDSSLTLRVRCRGKIHRFTVNKDDPLILLCSKLGKELGVRGEQILLSHSTATLSTSSSPASLGLSTVDIIDAIVVLDVQLQSNGGTEDTSALSHDPENCIVLKVQSAKKTTTYSISKNEGLSKVMTAFAAALEVPVNKIKFSFDGDPISPDHTPCQLDLENDDIIDARVLVS